MQTVRPQQEQTLFHCPKFVMPCTWPSSLQLLTGSMKDFNGPQWLWFLTCLVHLPGLKASVLNPLEQRHWLPIEVDHNFVLFFIVSEETPSAGTQYYITRWSMKFSLGSLSQIHHRFYSIFLWIWEGIYKKWGKLRAVGLGIIQRWAKVWSVLPSCMMCSRWFCLAVGLD